MNIGENILKLRKEKGLSQEQLGEKVGVTRQTISNWELNETIPDTNQLIALSKTLNISIDELVNNNVKDVIIEKVSNTEKLAGLVIKILKWLGIGLLVYFVLIIIAFIVLTTFRHQSTTDTNQIVSISCSLDNKEYNITLNDKKYFNCPECSKEINVYLKDITDWANLDNSLKNIENYFNENGGECE